MDQTTVPLKTAGVSLEPLVVVKPGTPLREIEKSVILATLRKQEFNRTRTARVLGIGIRTLQRRLKEYREIPVNATAS